MVHTVTVDDRIFTLTDEFGFEGEWMAFVGSTETTSASKEIELRSLHALLKALAGRMTEKDCFSILGRPLSLLIFSLQDQGKISSEEKVVISDLIEILDEIEVVDRELTVKHLNRVLALPPGCIDSVEDGAIPIASQRASDDAVIEMYRRDRKSSNSYRMYCVFPEGRRIARDYVGTLDDALYDLDQAVWLLQEHNLPQRPS